MIQLFQCEYCSIERIVFRQYTPMSESVVWAVGPVYFPFQHCVCCIQSSVLYTISLYELLCRIVWTYHQIYASAMRKLIPGLSIAAACRVPRVH